MEGLSHVRFCWYGVTVTIYGPHLTLSAFGGCFFGYDSSYISGVLAMDYFIALYTGLPIPGADATAAQTAAFVIPTGHKTLIVSILSAGTFFGALMAGDLSDWYGRRTTVISGCVIYGKYIKYDSLSRC